MCYEIIKGICIDSELLLWSAIIIVVILAYKLLII